MKYNRRFLGNPSYMITSGHYLLKRWMERWCNVSSKERWKKKSAISWRKQGLVCESAVTLSQGISSATTRHTSATAIVLPLLQIPLVQCGCAWPCSTLLGTVRNDPGRIKSLYLSKRDYITFGYPIVLSFSSVSVFWTLFSVELFSQQWLLVGMLKRMLAIAMNTPFVAAPKVFS